jgi:PBSX family phage terminase large subunit
MKLSSKQKEFWSEPLHRWNIKCGATRSGKTYLDYFNIARRIRERKGKDGTVVLIGNTLKGGLRRNIIDPMRNIYGAGLIGNLRSDNTIMMFGEKCECFGADNSGSVEKIQGMSIKYCYGDEIVTWHESVMDMLPSRLDKPYSCLDATCNPADPNHWLKKWVDGAPEKGIDLYYQHYSIFDNPFLPESVREELIKEYSGGVFYDRFILGNWAVAEGLIYEQVAREPSKYVVNVTDEYTKQFDHISIGVDFGGNRSLTAFVATAIHRQFTGITIVKDYRINATKGQIDADRVCREFAGFIQQLKQDFKQTPIKFCFADSAEQYLINSLKKAAMVNSLGIVVGDSAKLPIMTRIIAANTLFNTGRMFVSGNCRYVLDGLKQAVWDSKKPDTRLDNFVSDIDILDATEYSFERYLKYLLPDLKER